MRRWVNLILAAVTAGALYNLGIIAIALSGTIVSKTISKFRMFLYGAEVPNTWAGRLLSAILPTSKPRDIELAVMCMGAFFIVAAMLVIFVVLNQNEESPPLSKKGVRP